MDSTIGGVNARLRKHPLENKTLLASLQIAGVLADLNERLRTVLLRALHKDWMGIKPTARMCVGLNGVRPLKKSTPKVGAQRPPARWRKPLCSRQPSTPCSSAQAPPRPQQA